MNVDCPRRDSVGVLEKLVTGKPGGRFLTCRSPAQDRTSEQAGVEHAARNCAYSDSQEELGSHSPNLTPPISRESSSSSSRHPASARAPERRRRGGVDFRCWAGRILAAWRPTSDQGPVFVTAGEIGGRMRMVRDRGHKRRDSSWIGRRASGCVAGVIVLVGLAMAGVAAGAAPTIERITIDETFVDEELADACGIDDVTATVHGFVVERTFAGEGTGVAQVNSINVGVTETAGDRTFRFRDVGADVVQIKPDGSLCAA